MKMNILDRAVSWFSPEAGLKRARARVATDAVRSYSSAARKSDGFTPISQGPNGDVARKAKKVRDSVRDFEGVDPYITKMLNGWVAGLIRSGIEGRVSPKDPALAKHAQTVQATWDRWWFRTACDLGGLLTGPAIQAVLTRGVMSAGGSLLKLITLDPEVDEWDRETVPLKLQALEIDHLDTGRNGEIDGHKGYAVNGVHFSPKGQIAGYWIFPQHPNDGGRLGTLTGRLQSEFVGRKELRHVWLHFMARAGQTVGVSPLATAIEPLEDRGDLNEAVRMRARIEACLGVVVVEETDGDTELAEQGQLGTPKLSPGSITRVRANSGAGVQVVNPSGTGGLEAFAKQDLHAAAAGGGMAYYQVSGDLSGANYSSLKAGRIDFEDLREQILWLVLVPLMDEIFAAFVEHGVLMGRWPKGDYGMQWMPPAIASLDRLADVNADKAEVRAGFMSPQEAVGKRGRYLEDVVAEIEAANALFDGAGLMLDIDPRKVTGAGQATAPITPADDAESETADGPEDSGEPSEDSSDQPTEDSTDEA